MQGSKTHAPRLRTRENRSDETNQGARMPPQAREIAGHAASQPTASESEFPVSRRGMNQESDHNKHNDAGQAGHKPQQPSILEEKQK